MALNLLGSVYSDMPLLPWQEPFRRAYGHRVVVVTQGGRKVHGELLSPLDVPVESNQTGRKRVLSIKTKSGGVYNVKVRFVGKVEVVL